MREISRLHQYKIYYKILKRAFLQSLFPRLKIRRDKSFVINEYNPVWAEGAIALPRQDKPRAVLWHDRPMLWKGLAMRRFSISLLSKTISSLEPENVLELGSGNGFNILALAVLHPEIKLLRGVELTPSGVESSLKNLLNPPLSELSHVTELKPEVILERLRNRDIKFIQGDIRNLPFADKFFDCAFSHLTIEQIPRSYPEVFSEAKRISRKYTIFIEPFAEAQLNIFQCLHLKNVDYFRASYHEVEKAGLKVLKFEPLELSKIVCATGILLCSSED